MIIRGLQIRRMGEAQALQFERKLVDFLKSHMPARTSRMTPDSLRGFVRTSITWANQHGIVTQADLAEFCVLMLGLGEVGEVNAPDWVLAILNNHTLRPSTKILQIRTRVRKLESSKPVSG